MELLSPRKQRSRAILASQAELQSLEPRRRAGAVAVGVSLRLAPKRQVRLSQTQLSRGLLIGSVQTRLTFFVHGD